MTATVNRRGRPADACPVIAPELLDEPHIRTLREDYPEIVGDLVRLFADSVPPLIEDMRSADPEAVRRAAHKLKGACRQLGAARLGDAAGEIERAKSVSAAELVALERTFAATHSALRAA